jgi:hypothetical protein
MRSIIGMIFAVIVFLVAALLEVVHYFGLLKELIPEKLASMINDTSIFVLMFVGILIFSLAWLDHKQDRHGIEANKSKRTELATTDSPILNIPSTDDPRIMVGFLDERKGQLYPRTALLLSNPGKTEALDVKVNDILLRGQTIRFPNTAGEIQSGQEKQFDPETDNKFGKVNTSLFVEALKQEWDSYRDLNMKELLVPIAITYQNYTRTAEFTTTCNLVFTPLDEILRGRRERGVKPIHFRDYKHTKKPVGTIRPPNDAEILLTRYDDVAPKHHKRWLKIALCIAVVTVVVALCVGLWDRYKRASLQATVKASIQTQTQQKPRTPLPSTPSPITTSSKHNEPKPDAPKSSASPAKEMPKIADPAPELKQPVSPPTSASESIIPNDRGKGVEETNELRNALADVLGKKDTITFLMSWPENEDSQIANSKLVLVSGILSSACRTSPRQCWFKERANPNNLDYPAVPQPTRRGLTVHGVEANAISAVLGRWFTIYSSSSIPEELNVYKDPSTKELIWVEIGPGSLWKTDK